MPGFPLPEYDVAMNSDGSIDPYKHLFRASFFGVDKGPMISQVPFVMAVELNDYHVTKVGGNIKW